MYPETQRHCLGKVMLCKCSYCCHCCTNDCSVHTISPFQIYLSMTLKCWASIILLTNVIIKWACTLIYGKDDMLIANQFLLWFCRSWWCWDIWNGAQWFSTRVWCVDAFYYNTVLLELNICSRCSNISFVCNFQLYFFGDLYLVLVVKYICGTW